MLRHFRRYSSIYIMISIAVIWLFLGSDTVNAQCTATMTDEQMRVHRWEQLMSLLSWSWGIFAMIAGKLMTNTFVYGEFIGLDSYLWEIWNIIKNFANFSLGFIFLYYILRIIFSPSDENNEFSKTGFVQKMLPKFLIAGILIQASWFLVGAVVDVERIATVGMSGLPSVVIGQNATLQNSLASGHVALHRKITIGKSTNPCEGYNVESEPITPAPDVEQTYDAIIPRPDSFAGPLMFIGGAILDIPTVEYSDYNFSGDWGDIGIYAVFDIIKAIAFTFAMFAFALLNLIRIAYLWLFIALSPFVVLALVFKDLFKGISENDIFPLKPQKMLMYIFQPTIMVTLLSVILIVIVLMQNALVTHDVMGMDIQSLLDGNGESYKNDLFEIVILGTQITIGKLILRGFSLFLIFGLIMISGKLMGNNFVGNLTRQSLKLFTSIPFIPMKAASLGTKQAIAKGVLGKDATRRDFNSLAKGDLDVKRRQKLEGRGTGGTQSAQQRLADQYERKVTGTGIDAKEQFIKLTKDYITTHRATNLLADPTWKELFNKHLGKDNVKFKRGNISSADQILTSQTHWSNFKKNMLENDISIEGDFSQPQEAKFTIKQKPAPTNDNNPQEN